MVQFTWREVVRSCESAFASAEIHPTPDYALRRVTLVISSAIQCIDHDTRGAWSSAESHWRQSSRTNRAFSTFLADLLLAAWPVSVGLDGETNDVADGVQSRNGDPSWLAD